MLGRRPTVATRAEQIAALRDVLATGASAVTLDGKTVTYRSRAEIRAELAILEAEEAAATGGARPLRRIKAATRSGVA